MQLLCASDAAHESVEPLVPPEGAPIGERIHFGEAGASQPEPATPNQVCNAPASTSQAGPGAVRACVCLGDSKQARMSRAT